MKNKIVLCLTFFISIFSCAVYAIDSPLPMLQSTSQQILAQLKTHQQLKQDPAFIQQTVNQILVPHFDLPTMSHMVVGREAWNQASLQQRQQFMDEFTTLLIRTYSAALSSYEDQTINFYPIRGGVEGKTQTQVESKILRREGPSIPVNYRLKRVDDTWKVYDFSVDGVSLIESFRSQFATELAQGGMTQLLQTLSTHNKQRQ